MKKIQASAELPATNRTPFSLRKATIPTALALFMGACGGGSGSDSGSTEMEPGTTPDSPSASSIVITGSVGDGPIVGASITVLDSNHEIVATAKSDAHAKYSITVPANVKYPLHVQAEGGEDLVTGATPDFTVRAVISSESERLAHLSPFSTIIAAAATEMPGGLTASNLTAAKSVIMRYLNFGLDADEIPHPVHSPIGSSGAAIMVKASEALAETLRRVTTQLQLANPGLGIEDLVQSIASDIVDGAIDGEGASADKRTAATWHMAAAQVLSESLVNRLQVDGSLATQRLDDAIATAFPDSAQTTADVIISELMYEQTRVAFMAAQRLIPAANLPDLNSVRSQLPEQPLAADFAEVLPATLSAEFTPAATLVATATDEQLSEVVAVARAAAISDGTDDSWNFDSAYALRLSTSSDRSEPMLLQGQVIEGKAYVFTNPAVQTTEVKFFLNDPFMAASPMQTESVAPYDLAGTASDDTAEAFDTSTLPDGVHTVTAQMELSDGTMRSSHASFVVNNVDHLTSTLRLSWEAVADGADGYHVFYGTDPTSVDMLLFDLPLTSGDFESSAPSVTISPVHDLGIRDAYGSRACFTVQAYNTVGTSDRAEPVCSSI